jgi:hypothetical protein
LFSELLFAPLGGFKLEFLGALTKGCAAFTERGSGQIGLSGASRNRDSQQATILFQ